MGGDRGVEPHHPLPYGEPGPIINGTGSDKQVMEEPDTGSLASGIKTRRQLKKKLKRDLPIMGVSFLPFLALDAHAEAP